MYSTEEVRKLIEQGKNLLLSGHEKLLSKLPKGNWIGGTSSYFMTENGGLVTDDQIQVTELPDFIVESNFKFYDANSLKNIYKEGFENGFSVVIIPAFSDSHLVFANEVPNFDNFAVKPLIGWISGINLSDPNATTPKVFLGTETAQSGENAVVAHFKLPNNKMAEISINNIFTEGSGTEFEFPETGFDTSDVIIDGERMNFAQYLCKNNLDIEYPLVANYSGTLINISFKSIDKETKKVIFYAPVFKGIKYKFSQIPGDYVEEVMKFIPAENENQYTFSCNCVLNFLKMNLEGKKIGNICGPITFGEIAYQLLNQTLVNLDIREI